MEAAQALDIDDQPPLGPERPARESTPEDLDNEHREGFHRDREAQTREAPAQTDKE